MDGWMDGSIKKQMVKQKESKETHRDNILFSYFFSDWTHCCCCCCQPWNIIIFSALLFIIATIDTHTKQVGFSLNPWHHNDIPDDDGSKKKNLFIIVNDW